MWDRLRTHYTTINPEKLTVGQTPWAEGHLGSPCPGLALFLSLKSVVCRHLFDSVGWSVLGDFEGYWGLGRGPVARVGTG